MHTKKLKSKLFLNKQTIANYNLATIKGGFTQENPCLDSYITPQYGTGCACYESTPIFSCGCGGGGDTSIVPDHCIPQDY